METLREKDIPFAKIRSKPLSPQVEYCMKLTKVTRPRKFPRRRVDEITSNNVLCNEETKN